METTLAPVHLREDIVMIDERRMSKIVFDVPFKICTSQSAFCSTSGFSRYRKVCAETPFNASHSAKDTFWRPSSTFNRK